MIDRIDKRLVFKWLNNRPYFHGETEPCINGRILGLGAYFKEPNDDWPINSSASSSKMAAGTARHGPSCRRNALPAGALRSTPPSRARRTARLRTSRAQISGCHEGSQARRKLPPRTPHVPLASHRQSHRQALVTILVPDVLALRRLARTRVFAECRNQARPSRP